MIQVGEKVVCMVEFFDMPGFVCPDGLPFCGQVFVVKDIMHLGCCVGIKLVGMRAYDSETHEEGVWLASAFAGLQELKDMAQLRKDQNDQDES